MSGLSLRALPVQKELLGFKELTAVRIGIDVEW